MLCVMYWLVKFYRTDKFIWRELNKGKRKPNYGKKKKRKEQLIFDTWMRYIWVAEVFLFRALFSLVSCMCCCMSGACFCPYDMLLSEVACCCHLGRFFIVFLWNSFGFAAVIISFLIIYLAKIILLFFLENCRLLCFV